MDSQNRIARRSGLLYLLLVPFGVFGILYIPMNFIKVGDIASTINNIAADEFTFRLSILTALVTQLIQIMVVLSLYQLLKDVNRKIALLMVISILVAVPIAMLNEINHLALLSVLVNAELVSMFLNLHENGLNIAQLFWGLWLFPMGYLVYKSRFIPKFIGVLLIIGCFGYLADSFVFLLGIDLNVTFSEFTFLGEVALPLWLIIKGAKTAKH